MSRPRKTTLRSIKPLPDILTDAENKFIQSVVGNYPGEEIRFKGWSQIATTHLKKLNEAKKFQKRILIVGKYRIFIVAKGTMMRSNKIEKNYHLYDIYELAMEKEALLIKIGGRAVVILSSKIPQIVREIRNSYQKISYGFGRFAMQTSIPESELLPIDETPPGPANGLISNYMAQCSFLGTPTNAPFMNYVKNLDFTNDKVLNLENCPGIEPKSEITLDINSVLNTMALNTYFRAVIVKNIPIPKNSPGFGYMMRYNETLTQLILNNLEGGVNWILLGEALTENRYHSLQVIDFSHNEISVKDMQSLANGMASFTHSLRKLNLSYCNIPPKGISALFEAFEKNFGMSLTIEELSLSHNKFEDAGSNSCAQWLSQAREHSKLKKLELAFSSVVISGLGTWFRNLAYLEHLDLSGNKLDKEHCQAIKATVDSSATLRSLLLVSCKMGSDSVCEIATLLMKNAKLKNVDLNFSDIEFRDVSHITKPLTGECSLRSLNLTSCKLKGNGVIAVLKTLTNNTKTLQTLRIGKNLGSSEAEEEIATALADFITQNPSLKKLSFPGSKGSRLRQMRPLFSVLAHNDTLEELEIHGNSIGDENFLYLMECLSTNKRLKTLSIDKNELTINSFLGLKECLVYRNQTLTKIPYPHVDAEIALSTLSEMKKIQLRELFFEVSFLLKSNSKERQTSSKLQNFENIETVEPLSPVPLHLGSASTLSNPPPQASDSRLRQPFRPKSVLIHAFTDEDLPKDDESYDDLPPAPGIPDEEKSVSSSEFPVAKELQVLFGKGKDKVSQDTKDAGEKKIETKNVEKKIEPKDVEKKIEQKETDKKTNEFTNQKKTSPKELPPIPKQVKDDAETSLGKPSSTKEIVSNEQTKCRALYDYKATAENEISFYQDDIITIINKYKDTEWWKGEIDGKKGFFPSNFCEELEKATAIRAFEGTEEDELSFQVGDTIYILQKFEDNDWWQGEKDGEIGLFPYKYVELAEKK